MFIVENKRDVHIKKGTCCAHWQLYCSLFYLVVVQQDKNNMTLSLFIHVHVYEKRLLHYLFKNGNVWKDNSDYPHLWLYIEV